MTVIKKFLKLTFDVINGTKKDNVGAYSAQTAFFVTISFIPFIMLLLSILKFLPVEQDNMVLQIVSLFPAGAKELIASFIEETYDKSGAAVISITAVSTLWASSIGVFSLVKGINRVFCENETRNYFAVRFMSMIYTLLIMAILILCLGFLVFGNILTEIVLRSIPPFLGETFILEVIRVALGFVILSVFFVVMYVIVPNRKTKIYAQFPGAVLCSAGWTGFSYVFSYYYENIANYSYLYGSLSVLVFFMLWLFVCIYMLFIGAEINKSIEKNHENA